MTAEQEARETLRRGLFTFTEAADRTGLSEDELRDRIPAGMLVRVTKPGEPAREKIPEYALAAIGAVATAPTGQEAKMAQLVAFLQRTAGAAVTNANASNASGLPTQAVKIALGMLSVLGFVQKSYEPPANGRGGRITVWRWLGDQS